MYSNDNTEDDIQDAPFPNGCGRNISVDLLNKMQKVLLIHRFYIVDDTLEGEYTFFYGKGNENHELDTVFFHT
jgi:hypothetical protein